MKVTVVGAGNVGTQLAAHAAERGHQVTLSTSRPEEIDGTIVVVDETGAETHRGTGIVATADDEAAFADADLVFVTVPSFHTVAVADRIVPYAHAGMKVGAVPGSGGAEMAFQGLLPDGVTVFGLQRVPSVARLVERGRVVRAVGCRPMLHVAALPAAAGSDCAAAVCDALGLPCRALPTYLDITLVPSNPILHTTRLTTLFRDYQDGVVYPQVPLFYEEWDEESSRLLFACDDELQAVCRAIPDVDLSGVVSLRRHYESETPEELTAKIRSIEGFKGLPSPVKEAPGGLVPDFSSRYFTADFPYGLQILLETARLAGVDAPAMRETYDWYENLQPGHRRFRFADHGIETLEDLVTFYAR